MIEISSRAVPFDEFSTVLRVAAVFFILPLLSFTALADQKKAPVPEKERTRGDFTVNINLAFPVFSSGPETYGYEAVGLTICPTIETGVGYGTTNRVRESTRAVFGVSTTLLYRPLKWFHTGIDLKYVFLSNSDNRWLMLGFKFGVDF